MSRGLRCLYDVSPRAPHHLCEPVLHANFRPGIVRIPVPRIPCTAYRFQLAELIWTAPIFAMVVTLPTATTHGEVALQVIFPSRALVCISPTLSFVAFRTDTLCLGIGLQRRPGRSRPNSGASGNTPGRSTSALSQGMVNGTRSGGSTDPFSRTTYGDIETSIGHRWIIAES